jgi:hypothetical protein
MVVPNKYDQEAILGEARMRSPSSEIRLQAAGEGIFDEGRGRPRTAATGNGKREYVRFDRLGITAG